MVLKNKDGTPYQLFSRPNPLMKTQDKWDDFVLHNFQWNSQSIKNNDKVNTVKSDFAIKEKELPEEIPEIKEALPEKEVLPEVKEVVEQVILPKIFQDAPVVPSPEVNLPPKVRKTLIYCLPAVIKETRDELYNEVRRRVIYQKPFSFEGVIVEVEDLHMIFWTTLDKVSKESIIYPSNLEKRWWKVSEIQDKTGGYLVKVTPSESHPSFHL